MSDKSVIYCKCGTPIGKRLDSRKLETVRYHNGVSVKNTFSYSGDTLNMSCGKCDSVTTFMVNKITKPLSYVIAVPQS